MRDQAQHLDRMNPRNQEVFDYLMKNQYDNNTFPKHAHHQSQIIDTTIPKHINHNAVDKSRFHDSTSVQTGNSTRTGKTAVTSVTSSSHTEDEHGPPPDLVFQSLSESLSVEHPPSEAMNPIPNETCTLKRPDVVGSNNSACTSESVPEHQYPQEDMNMTLLEHSQVQAQVPSMLHRLGDFFKNPISCGDEVVPPSKDKCVNEIKVAHEIQSHSKNSDSSKRTSKSVDESKQRIAILEASLAEKTREIEKLTKLQELVVTEVSKRSVKSD